MGGIKKVLIFFLIMQSIFNAHGLFSKSWSKPPSERATSLAVDVSSNKVYISYLDLTKNNGTVGKVLSFDLDKPQNLGCRENEVKMPNDSFPVLSPIAVRSDKCNNLWILDSGVQNISGNQVKSPPTIQAINLKNNELHSKFVIPEDLLKKASFLTSFVTDVPNKCDEAHIYIADFNRPGLLCYHTKDDEASLISHHYFYPDPLLLVPDDFIFNKKQKDISGVFGLGIVNDVLQFHPLASTHEFSIALHLIRSIGSIIGYKDIKVAFDRPKPAGAMVHVPEKSVTFFAETEGVGCIGRKRIYKTLQLGSNFPSGYVTDLALNGTSLWVLVNSKDMFFVEELNITDLIKGSDCEGLEMVNGNGTSNATDTGIRGNFDEIKSKSASNQIVTIIIVMTFVGLRIF